jgi:hypothetical protein
LADLRNAAHGAAIGHYPDQAANLHLEKRFLLGIGDPEFFDPLFDRGFRVRRIDAAKDRGTRPLDAGDFQVRILGGFFAMPELCVVAL